MKLKYRCLIIDHDDTAVDSTAKIHYPAHVEVMGILRPGTEPVTLREWFLKNFHPGIMEYLTDELGMTQQEMEVEYDVWKAHTEATVPDFYPGFIEALTAYRERGGIVAVVSHSEKHIIERDYRSYNGNVPFMPDIIFGWDYDKELRKPSPRPVLEILEKYKLDPFQALILDDLKPGVLMGKRTGVEVAGAGWGHNIPEIADYMREHCIVYFERVKVFASFILSI
jgi:beta-phosphoglucomutase-like phosphatase (HAD superfamily)